ncbi:Sterol uptake control protein 2 [Cytospora mali]|uniref:Sterol uptake control protein 2 n=1 Tax=Cytospora mali TaxID=578113 RepID=A0A194VZQ9_CYTMA|nr:Sterol uptake control protein 2 [Valsa mali]
MDCSWPRNPLDNRRSSRLQSSLSPNPHSHLSPSNISARTGSTPGHTPEQGSILPSWPRWPDEGNIFTQHDDSSDIGLPESRSRRLLEHRLMQNYYLNIQNPFPVSPAPDWRRLWTKVVPEMALHHDSILNAMLACSVTHLLRSNPGDNELFTARQNYFISALHAQRQEVANVTVDNAEVVCFAALIISVTSFAMLKERSLHPYQPPMEWLQVGRGAGTVIWQSVDTIITQSKEGDHPNLMMVAGTYPYFGHDQSYFSPEMRRDFDGVLTQHLPSGDDWSDEETREAYEKTLSYVGSIQRGINNGEPVYAVARRVQTFALVAPPKYIELLGIQRPRALVILAHFWATVAQVHNVWWMGEDDALGKDTTAKREIRAIKGVLPQEWSTTMVWPLDVVGLRDRGYACEGPGDD